MVFLFLDRKISTNGNLIKLVLFNTSSPRLTWVQCGGGWHRCYNINQYSIVLTTKSRTFGQDNVNTDQVTPSGESVYGNLNIFNKAEFRQSFNQQGFAKTNALFIKLLGNWRSQGSMSLLQHDGVAVTALKKIQYGEFIKNSKSPYIDEVNYFIINDCL